MQRKIEMMKKHFKLICTVIFAVALTLILSGCGRQEQNFEGKNIVTFELQGGVLGYGTASTNTNIYYAYEPGSYILEPEKLTNYTINRTGYDFTGWYTDTECTKPWDFKTPFTQPELTLYAGWKVAISYTYSVYYVDEVTGTPHLLGVYDDVKDGARFEDWRGYAKNRSGYTPMNFYSDAELTTIWNNEYKFLQEGVDKDVPVYVSYIKGEYELVSDYSQLNTAIKAGKNVYLLRDIDCGGKDLSYGDYNGEIAGNGYTIKNFTVPKSGTSLNPTCSIFKNLGKDAKIANVSFTEAKYVFTDVNALAKSRQVAALAVSFEDGATVADVTVSGTITTNYDGELTRLNSFVYESDIQTSGTCSVNITVAAQ